MSNDKFANRSLVKTVTLPSRGFLYGGQLPDGKVRIASLTTMEEKIMVGVESTADQRIEELLVRCTDLGPMSTKQLIVEDRAFLLFQIRAITFGPEYGFPFQCPACRRSHRVEMNIDQETVRVLEESDTEPFEVALPICDKKVGVRLLRGHDEIEIRNHASKVFSKREKASGESGDPAYHYRLAKQLVWIENEDNVPVHSVKMKFVQELCGADSFIFRKAVQDFSPGYSMEKDVVCPHCGHEEGEFGVPMSNEFFSPLSVNVEYLRGLRSDAARPGPSGVLVGGHRGDEPD